MTADDVPESCVPPRSFKLHQLYDPTMSIKYGACYLDLMITRNNGNLVLALLAYNGGQVQANRLVSRKKRMAYESMDYALQIMYRVEQCGPAVKGEQDE